MNLMVPTTTTTNASCTMIGVAQSSNTHIRPPLVDSFVTYPKLQIPLLGRITPEWKIVRPLLVTVELDEYGYYIASDDEFCVYGYGKTPSVARKDYIASLIEYYQLIIDREDEPTQALFRHLYSYLQPIISK